MLNAQRRDRQLDTPHAVLGCHPVSSSVPADAVPRHLTRFLIAQCSLAEQQWPLADGWYALSNRLCFESVPIANAAG